MMGQNVITTNNQLSTTITLPHHSFLGQVTHRRARLPNNKSSDIRTLFNFLLAPSLPHSVTRACTSLDRPVSDESISSTVAVYENCYDDND